MRYNWHITLCKFKVYNMMIWCIYTDSPWLTVVWLKMGRQWYTFSRNCASSFAFWSFPRLMICNMILSCDAVQWQPQLPFSHSIRRVNNWYTYNHSLSIQSFLCMYVCIYWSIVELQCSVNFCCTAKWFRYRYIYIHSFLYSFPLWFITGYWI